MSDTPGQPVQPGLLPWVQFRQDLLAARETRRKAAIEAVRRFVDAHPGFERLPRRRARIRARLQFREDLLSARFEFRRAALQSIGRLTSTNA